MSVFSSVIFASSQASILIFHFEDKIKFSKIILNVLSARFCNAKIIPSLIFNEYICNINHFSFLFASYARIIFATIGWRTTSDASNSIKPIPFTFLSTCLASTKPDGTPLGRSI